MRYLSEAMEDTVNLRTCYNTQYTGCLNHEDVSQYKTQIRLNLGEFVEFSFIGAAAQK